MKGENAAEMGWHWIEWPGQLSYLTSFNIDNVVSNVVNLVAIRMAMSLLPCPAVA